MTAVVRENRVLADMRRFSAAYGRTLTIAGDRWRYHRLGAGPAVVWLTGGLRRAAFGFGFLELLADRYTVLAPDYPPLRTFAGFDRGLTAILHAEGIDGCHLVGQSYGGMLAQAFLAGHPRTVDRLVLSSTGPADYGRAWLPVEYLAIGLARLLPEPILKRILAAGLERVVTAPPAQRDDWLAAVRTTIENDLTRDDVISHFAVAADIIGTRLVRPDVFGAWRGRVVVLRADNDPTQSRRDQPRYERLFARPVQVVSMGGAGHTAALADPRRYVTWLDRALTGGPGPAGGR